MISENEKLKFISSEIEETYNLLFETIRILYKEEKDEKLKEINKKIYIIIPILLLSFCFLDFLRRINYILENGKDGNENKDNRIHYEEFLTSFIINNDKYKIYSYSLTANNFYEIRCGLVHQLSLKELIDNGKTAVTFIDGRNAEEIKSSIETCLKERYPAAEFFHVITIKSFLEIVKEGLMKMIKSYEKKLKENPKEEEVIKAHLNDLYEEFQKSIRYHIIKE